MDTLHIKYVDTSSAPKNIINLVFSGSSQGTAK